MNEIDDQVLLDSGFQPHEIPMAKLALTIFTLNEQTGNWEKRV